MVNKIKNKICLASYTLLQPLPGLGGGGAGVTGLSQYLGWLYKFALAAAAFLAVLMIVIGGIQMIVGGASETARSDGKRRIEQAIWGLLLAITAWLILYSINPDLVKTGLTIPDITIEAPVVNTGESPFFCVTSATTDEDLKGLVSGGLKGYATIGECATGCTLITGKCVQQKPNMPPGTVSWPLGPAPSGTVSDTTALREELKSAGITLNKENCAYQGQTSCTSLYGLPESTIRALKDLEKISGPFVITGGTEPGHQTHGPGNPIVDIRYSTMKESSLLSLINSGKISSYICELGSKKLPCDDPTSDHFHVVFK